MYRVFFGLLSFKPSFTINIEIGGGGELGQKMNGWDDVLTNEDPLLMK